MLLTHLLASLLLSLVIKGVAAWMASSDLDKAGNRVSPIADTIQRP